MTAVDRQRKPGYTQGADDDPPPEDSDLTPADRAAFAAQEFDLGKVPELVPPLMYR